MKELINRLASAIYRLVFRREMSAAEADFVQSLSWVGAGTFVATALTAAFSVLGGRLLGPEEYGKFTLIQSVAMLLYIPMLMGFNIAMLKHGAEQSDSTKRRSVLSSAHLIIAAFTIVSATIMIVFSRPLSQLFASTPDLFGLSVCFAVLYTVFTLAQTTLRSLNRMRAFALSQPIHTGILLAAFAVFALANRLSSATMVHSKLIAFGLTSVAIHVLYTRQHWGLHFDRAWARELSKFAFAHIIAVASVAVYYEIGKIMVARYMTLADVGIYGAYFMATMSVASVLWQVFNMVFFPTASRYRDKRPLLRRINRLVPFVAVTGIPLIMGVGYVILRLYGADYTFSTLWLALFATGAIMFIIRGFYAWLLTSEGYRGAFASSLVAVATAAASVVLNILLVPKIGVPGAAVAAIIAHAAGLALFVLKGRRYLGKA